MHVFAQIDGNSSLTWQGSPFEKVFFPLSTLDTWMYPVSSLQRYIPAPPFQMPLSRNSPASQVQENIFGGVGIQCTT